MNSTAKAHEPTMEEILASIRRIIADDDPESAAPVVKAQPAEKVSGPKPVETPAPAAPDESAALNQGDIDAMFASVDAPEPPQTVEAEKPAPQPAEAEKSTDEELAAAWGAESGTAEDDDEDDVLELTQIASVSSDAYAATEEKAAGFDTDLDDVAFTEPDSDAPASDDRGTSPGMDRLDTPSSGAASRPAFSENLIAEKTGEAVSAAFGSLSNTILSQNARTLDELVQDMLRPMLKEWLDDNLPQIVERLVRAEIERVSRGRR